ncbi:DUF47 family protein [Actinomycetaceae bacterium MB13-C1-2]|nr:DUF47 family protein [Actinomycetaceae bacterium MB13-C1-2]
MAIKTDRGPSFFDLLANQASKLVGAAEMLQRILDTQGDERRDVRAALHDIEHEADDINHQFVQKLNGSFITPFDRDDMSELAHLLDDCVDLMDEAGDMIVLYRLENIPQPFYDLLGQQVQILARCAELTHEAMPKIKKPRDLKAYWLEINILENQGDQVYRRTLGNLFDSDLDPLMVIKLKDVVEILEKCADAFETLAMQVETIAVKES